MAESLACVATDLRNPLTCRRIYFCHLTFPWLADPEAAPANIDRDKDKKDPPSPFRRYLDGLTVAPLKQAYVLCISPQSDATRGPLDPRSSCLGLTDDNGMLNVITESEIGVSSNSKKTPALLRTDSVCLYYWTHSPTAIRRVLADLRRNPDAVAQHEFFGLRVGFGSIRDCIPRGTPFRQCTPFDLKGAGVRSARETFLAPLLRHLIVSLKQNTLTYDPAYDRRDFTGGTAKESPSSLPDGPYHLAHCRLMDTIHVCELALFQALAIRQRSAEDFAFLNGVLRMCTDMADKELVDKFLKNTLSEWRREQLYYTYAYNAAVTLAVERSDFAKSIHMAGQVAWKEAANEVAKHKVHHPGYNERLKETVETLPPKDRDQLLDYFDHHRFYFRYKEKLTAIPASDRGVALALTGLRGRLRELVSNSCAYDKVFQHLEAHCPDKLEDRRRMHERYLETALDIEYPWWNDVKVLQVDKAAAAAFKKCFDGLGTGTDKIGDLLGSHFKTVETLRKYIQIMSKGKRRVDFKSLDEVIIGASIMNDVVKGPTKYPNHPRGSVEINWETNEMTLKVKLNGSKDEVVGRFLFDAEHDWRGHKGLTRVRRGKTKFVELKTPPLHDGKLPAFLSTFGDTLGLVSSVIDVCDEEKRKDGIQVYGKVAMNTFQSVDSWAGLLGMIWKDAGLVSKLEPVARAFKGAGLLLEVVFNVADGVTILRVEGEDSEAGAAVRTGDIGTAWAKEVKGITLTGLSAGGAVACLYGGVSLARAGMTVAAAFGAALTPLGIALAIAGLTCLAIDIGVYFASGPANTKSELANRVEAAIEREYMGGRERTVDAVTDLTKAFSSVLA